MTGIQCEDGEHQSAAKPRFCFGRILSHRRAGRARFRRNCPKCLFDLHYRRLVLCHLNHYCMVNRATPAHQIPIGRAESRALPIRILVVVPLTGSWPTERYRYDGSLPPCNAVCYGCLSPSPNRSIDNHRGERRSPRVEKQPNVRECRELLVDFFVDSNRATSHLSRVANRSR
jgi:hypothetical protein